MTLTRCDELGIGVEIEYMIVDAESLQQRPIAEQLLAAIGTPGASEVDLGRVRVSNESTRHQIELKTNGPAPRLAELVTHFRQAVQRLNLWLGGHGAMLLPSGMHPFLKPHEVMFWELGENIALYRVLGALFDRRTHGWANLQSCHLNLPYASPSEFRELHSAIRVLLPLLPALAASSPIVEGVPTGKMDSRLAAYRHRRARFHTLCPAIIPEVVASPADYARDILEPAYAEVFAATGTTALQFPWINDRGAIGRIDRGSIEIRIIDAQEEPAVDLAIAALVRAVLKDLVARNPVALLESFSVARLMSLLNDTIHGGGRAAILDDEFLSLFGTECGPCAAGQLWGTLIKRFAETDADVGALYAPLERICAEGTLAERIVRSVETRGLLATYQELGSGLRSAVAV